MATNFDILEKAEKLELLFAELYGAFARVFGADAEAAALFARLKHEEEQHAARVRMLGAQSRRDSKLLGKIQADVEAMDEVAADLVAMIANARSGAWRGDLAQTRKILLDLEARAARAHAQAMPGLDESLRRFFEQLAAQDRAHEELLRR